MEGLHPPSPPPFVVVLFGGGGGGGEDYTLRTHPTTHPFCSCCFIGWGRVGGGVGGEVCLAHTSVFVSSFHVTRDCLHTHTHTHRAKCVCV